MIFEHTPIELSPPQEPPAANERIECAACGATYRVVEVSGPVMRAFPSTDAAFDWQASSCGRCQPGVAVRFHRPVATRLRLRELIARALDRWEALHWSQDDADEIARTRAELNLPRRYP